MKKTKFLALILACLMILSALPVSIAAETAEVKEVAAYADTYVSSANPDTAYGSADELKLSAAGKDENIIFVSFASSILQNEYVDIVIPNVDIPGDATNTVDVEVYVVSGAIDEATLTYNTMPSLSSAYFMGTFKFKNGDNLLDLSSIKSVVSGDYFTLAIRMADPHYYYEDFDDLTTFFLDVDPANNVNDYNQCYYSVKGVPTNAAFPGGEPISKGLSSVADDTTNNTKALYYYTQKNTARAKLANTLSYDELSLNDLGRRYRVTFDVYSELGAKVTFGLMSANGGAAVSGYSGPKSSYYTNFYKATFIGDSDNVTPTAKTWTPVTFDVTVDQTMITSQIGCVTVQCSGATASEDSKFYFDLF